jgi:hypothetical protein
MSQKSPEALVRCKRDYGSYGGYGTLPESWIPPAATRGVFVQQRVSAKNPGLAREAVLVTAKPVTKKLLLF